MKQPSLYSLLATAMPGRDGELAGRRLAMLEQLLAILPTSRSIHEVHVAEARTWLAGDWRFYEIPGEPLRVVEEIRWTWRGNVHTFSIEGYAPAPSSPTRSPEPIY